MYSSDSVQARVRKNTLLRALYPKAAPPDAMVLEDPVEDGVDEAKRNPTNLGQLILRPGAGIPTAPSQGPSGATSSAGDSHRKRIREQDMSIIPIDPAVLKAKAEKEAKAATAAKLKEKPKWILKRVHTGHQGRVRALCCEPDGQWFASSGGDTVIKVWDLATGRMKLDLVGHSETVRGLAVSVQSPYMYSCSEDRTVRCWDLEKNAVVRDFHGHLSAVYSVATHPTQDIIITGGRDATVRVWDIRTRKEAYVFQGHEQSVLCVSAQRGEPQVLSGGADGFIYLWDLVAGKHQARLTRHKKPVRSLVLHPFEASLVSCGADNIRKWNLPSGEFNCNLSNLPDAPDGLWSTGCVSPYNVLFTGSEEGGMRFYDWETSTMFQHGMTVSAPGTVLGEGGILASTFDPSGKRLLTAEGDKTVKMWWETPSEVPSAATN